MAIYSALYGTARYGESYYGVMVETIDSQSYIKTLANEETINSDSYIKATVNETIDSQSHIFATPEETIESLSYIKITAIEETIESESSVSRTGVTETLESESYITLNKVLPHGFQRSTWYDGTRYWRSSYDYTNSRIIFEYTTDKENWTENVSARLTINAYNKEWTMNWADYSVAQRSGVNLFITYKNGDDIEARQASTYPGTGFGWGAATTVFDGSADSGSYNYANICNRKGNKLAVTGVLTITADNGRQVEVKLATASNSIAGWGTATTVSNVDLGNATYVSLRSTADQDDELYIVWNESNTLKGRFYDGDWAASAETIATINNEMTTNYRCYWGLEHSTDAKNSLNVVYIDNTNKYVYFRKNDDASIADNWNGEILVISDTTCSYPCITESGVTIDEIFIATICGNHPSRYVYMYHALSPHSSWHEHEYVDCNATCLTILDESPSAMAFTFYCQTTVQIETVFFEEAFFIDSQSYILSSGNDETIESESFILMPAVEGSIDLLSYTLTSSIEETIDLLSYIKTLANEETINSDSYILSPDNEETIDLLSYILVPAITETIDSQSFILGPAIGESIAIRSYILSPAIEETINLQSYILTSSIEETIESESCILTPGVEGSINLISYTKTLGITETIDLQSYLLTGSIEETIDSQSYIKRTYTIDGPLPSDINTVAYWKLNDNTNNNTVIDSSSYSNDGTFVDPTGDPNTDAHHVASRTDGALEFDGVDDKIESNINQDLSTSSFTISIWAKMQKTGTSDYVFQTSSGSSYIHMHFNPEDLVKTTYRDEASNSGYIISFTRHIDTWMHYVFQRDYGNKFYLYVNGVVVGSGNVDDKGAIFGLGTSRIGNSFEGFIDEVKIFNRALSAGEILLEYNSMQYVKSESYIKINIEKTINTQSFILKSSVEETIDSQGCILKIQTETIESESMLLQTYDSTIESISYIHTTYDVCSINSQLVISTSCYTGVEMDMVEEILSDSMFRQKCTYRRYSQHVDNITGDLQFDDYIDYTIYAEIQRDTLSLDGIEIGNLGKATATIMLLPNIKEETDGTVITSAFRPAINDELTTSGNRYRIVDITPVMLAETEVMLECTAKRI